jgi:hypothetical protein
MEAIGKPKVIVFRLRDREKMSQNSARLQILGGNEIFFECTVLLISASQGGEITAKGLFPQTLPSYMTN